MNDAPKNTFTKIGVLGAGAWGTALAIQAAAAGAQVTLWARRPAQAKALAETRRNDAYLPAATLDDTITVTDDLTALADCHALLLVTPAQHLRALCQSLAADLPMDRPLVICAKGIEQNSGALLSDVVADSLPNRPCAILTGPSFAAEVARGLPTAITLATDDAALGEALAVTLRSRTFRPYLSSDPVGAQLGGAVKNVIAIACGIVAGLALGENARAALITRGLAEITRLGLARGARAETFMGLSGLGDLILTCGSTQSRNYSLGLALGQGRSLEAILAERQAVTEGVHSAGAVTALAASLGVETPICGAVDAVVNRGADLTRTIESLLARPIKAE